jgi:hypothetical protein
VPETPDRGAKPATRRSLRPPPLGHAWAWIVIAVGLVILMSIALWVVVSGRTIVEGLSGRDSIHQTAKRWRTRWAQAPGPPAVYVDQAKAFVEAGDVQQASMRLSMALSLDSNDANSWLRMVCLSAVKPAPEYGLTDKEIEQVLEVLAGEAVDPVAFEIAHSWQKLHSVEGASNPWLNRCFGVSARNSGPETLPETLDTLPAPP